MTLNELKTVSEFLTEALNFKENDLVKNIAQAIGKSTPWAKDIANNAPWVQDFAEAAGTGVPLVAFFLKYAQLLMLERDPNKQGYSACTLAYNRAVEEVFLARSMELQKIKPYSNNKILTKKNPDEIDMTGFKLDNALSHDFIIHADKVFCEFAEVIQLENNLINQLSNSIKQSFIRNLRLLLVHPNTEKKFAAFSELIDLDNSQAERQKILDLHLSYQSWLFNEQKVFQQETFALNHIYLETECGVLKYSQIKPQEENKFNNYVDREDNKKGKDPFSEKDSDRRDLLTTVIDYIGDPEFNEPIVIQGVAGSGKSSFTLRLVDELKEQGCFPIRILLKHLSLKESLEDAVPYALQFGEKVFKDYSWKPAFDDDWFTKLVSPQNREYISFGKNKTQLSPYIFIFDGWDEISTAANQGFRDSIDQVLGEIRDILIRKRDGLPMMRVIVTGRPTVDVTNTKLLRKDTPILTIRPLQPQQLKGYINKFQQARQAQPLFSINLETQSQSIINVVEQNIKSEFFQTISDTYEQAFQGFLEQNKRNNISELKGSLAVLGLPLLAYLTLRLMFKIQSEEELKNLINNPTNLYRSLVDETCEGSGNPIFIPELKKEDRYRLSGNDLRGLLWRTAEAITALGKESISREELKLRCGEDELEEIVEEATADRVLSRLIISFFFKESAGEGCEFLHKSFREYLFAEGVIEELKRYSCNLDVIQTYQDNPEKGYEERKIYWQEFEEDDPRYDLTRRLSELFATHWLSSEIKDHIFNLLTWEINRSAEKLSPSNLSTHPISIQQWEYIRDALADVWDWWGEGVFLRPQPKIIQEKRKTKEYIFEPPYVDELTELCSPLDKDVWKTGLPEPERSTTVDGRLGDAFFDLTAVVHSTLYEYQRQKLDSSLNVKDIEAKERRRYQRLRLARDEQGQDVALIQFAPSGEDSSYFRNYCHRINAAGWRVFGSFPSHVRATLIYLNGAYLNGADLYKAYLSAAELYKTNLSAACLRRAYLNGADLSEAYLNLADLRRAYLNGAYLSLANLSLAYLSGANLSLADLTGADLSGADLSGADLSGADLSGADLSGANFSGANLRGVRNITPEQVKQANNWELAKFDKEMKAKLRL
ncbi:pentapeptide repeat-containing protein [Crocosphaera sp.]|uniref:pentapeptide repeat-containing protein n=1 Tax=Crocosphaera sp. TaxID=2729996 RepID=UPI0026367519|nr:pentapeptide repeat-containing protein [Crocosphaera sp.]MDJ0582947.1 pentapeptide repeat-containing protein [Crocosphaera sp.]